MSSIPCIGWRGRKLYTARFKRPDFDVVVAHNAAGFRKQVNLEPKLDKAPHSIFVFGDSFVWGWGVGQGEVFTDEMNLLLPNYSVHNYGIDGVGTVVEYLNSSRPRSGSWSARPTWSSSCSATTTSPTTWTEEVPRRSGRRRSQDRQSRQTADLPAGGLAQEPFLPVQLCLVSG